MLPIGTSVLCALVLSLGAQNAEAQVQPSPALDGPSASQKIVPGGEKMLINVVSIEGASIFSEAQLLQVLTEGLGHALGVKYDMVGLLSLGEALTNHCRLKGYPFAMGGSGLCGEVSSSRNDYALGADFVGIGGHSETQSITLSYPVVRSSQTNLTASLGYEKGAMSDGLNG